MGLPITLKWDRKLGKRTFNRPTAAEILKNNEKYKQKTNKILKRQNNKSKNINKEILNIFIFHILYLVLIQNI